MDTSIHTYVVLRIIQTAKTHADHKGLVERMGDLDTRRSLAYKYLGKRATHELFAPRDTMLRKKLLAALAVANYAEVDEATVYTFPDSTMLEIHSDDQWMWNSNHTLIISDCDGVQQVQA